MGTALRSASGRRAAAVLAEALLFSRGFHLQPSNQLLKKKNNKKISSKPDGERL